MLRTACVALALASLGACASVGHHIAAFAGGAYASFDEGLDAAPVEDVAAMAVLTLDRRRFSLPSQRQPDLRMILATSYDRKYRHMRRRRMRITRRR